MFADPVAYDGFMGRYSVQLAPQMANFAGVVSGQRVLDVGAGTGVLTRELINRVGQANVVAADPSPEFVAALGERFPGIRALESTAEALPLPDAAFDAAVAQLVVHFMTDPIAGISQMARVTRPTGVVAACVWDRPMADQSVLSVFWRAARDVDVMAAEDDKLVSHEGELARMFEQAGLADVEQSELWVHVRHETFDNWWMPYENGTGPAGRYLAKLDAGQRANVRDAARRLVGDGPFDISGRAWAARGVVSG